MLKPFVLRGECEFYHGMPRSTKTLKMTKEAVLDYFKEDRRIVANYHFYKVPYTYVRVENLIDWIFETLDDRAYTLCIDEIQNEVDGRDFSTWTNKDFSKFIAQCGKRNIRIKYASQFGGGAELRLRQITDRIIYCYPIRDPTDENQFTNLLAGYYEVYDRENRRKPIASYLELRQALQFFWRFYKTRELIAPHDLDMDKPAEPVPKPTRDLDKLRDELRLEQLKQAVDVKRAKRGDNRKT